VNHKNQIVAMYYWSTKDLFEHHIAGTILKIKK